MKKVLALVLAVIMIFSCVVVSSASEKTQLKFNADGKFKILALADIQSGYPVGEALQAFISEALDKTQPDLVVFVGDNIMSPEDGTEESYWKGYDEVFPILEAKGVKFTFVYGNHDDESMPTISKEQMLEKYQTYDGCLAYDAVPELHGCATHNLPIMSSDGSKIAYNIWLMDSGDYACTEDGESYYDCVRADQIEWYENTSKALQEQNGGELVPSIMFQHIVPQEVAQKVMFSLPFQLGKITKNFEDGTSMTYLPNYFAFDGLLSEAPCPSYFNEGQWDSLVSRGDVKAMFFGHDHVNSYMVNVDGIDAMNVPGATFKSYSSYTDHGATLITLDEKDLSTYETEMIYVNDLALEEGSKLPGLDGSMSKAGFVFSKICRYLVTYLLKALRFLGAKVAEYIAL